MLTEDQYKVLFQSSAIVYIKIQWLDFDTEIKTDEIIGEALDGNISINGDSAARRTGNLKIALIGTKYLPSSNSHIWLNRKCKILIGLSDFINDKIIWFDKGNFIIDAPTVKVSNLENTLELSLLDYMCFYDGTLSGTLNEITKIVVGTPIQEAIKLLFSLGGCNKFLIDNIIDETINEGNNLLLIPETIEKEESVTIYDFAKEIQELYKGYELFFNENGYLIYRKIKNKINDVIQWNFNIDNDDDSNLAISYENKFDFHNVRNHIIIKGKKIDPLVGTPGTDKDKENNENILIVYFNKPLYDKNNQPLQNKTNVKDCFNYDGASSNYIDAIYTSDSGYIVTFNIKGEYGKCLTSIDNKLFDSSTLQYEGGKFEFSIKDDLKWSVPNFIIIDYTNNIGTFINNQIIPPDKLILKFNKPLYDISGNKLENNSDIKTYFNYNGNSTNYISATYIIDEYGLKYEVHFQFQNLQSNDELVINSDKIYDSAAIEISIEKYIFNGDQWYEETDKITSDYQIQYETQNNIKNHPFSIDLIKKRDLTINDEKIFTPLQAKNRGDYELWNHSNMAEKINLVSMPVYFLQANQIVHIKDSSKQIDGIYCVTQIDIPLKYDGTMNVSTYRVYDENVI